MKKLILLLIFMQLGVVSMAQDLYKNMNAPIHERIQDLLSKLTIEEKISLLRATSPGIERMGIDKYYMGNEALHGIIRPGKFTVFPQAIGLGGQHQERNMRNGKCLLYPSGQLDSVHDGHHQITDNKVYWITIKYM